MIFHHSDKAGRQPDGVGPTGAAEERLGLGGGDMFGFAISRPGLVIGGFRASVGHGKHSVWVCVRVVVVVGSGGGRMGCSNKHGMAGLVSEAGLGKLRYPDGTSVRRTTGRSARAKGISIAATSCSRFEQDLSDGLGGLDSSLGRL